jgi:predicted nucleotidyltransferase
MGNKTQRFDQVSAALFSPVQAATLALLFGQPEQRFAIGEIIRRIGRGSGAVQRQLAALLAADLVTLTKVGNQRHYQANRNSPVFFELNRLVLKTAALVGPLGDALVTLAPDIEAAFVFGSFAAGTAKAESDVDLMVIKRDDSTLDHATAYEALRGAEELLQRRIEPVLMTISDWRTKRAVAGSFAQRVASGPTLAIIGAADGDVTA